MLSWGAPAKGANVSSPNPAQSPQTQASPAPEKSGQNHNRHERHSPYPSNSQSQNRQGNHTPGGLYQTPEQNQQSGGVPNFSCDNPFMSKTRFSADNPFNNTSDSLMGSDNPYSQRDMSSPIHPRAPRPSFQPSPLMRTPFGRGHQPRFSPRTPSSGNFNSPSSRFQSPSPRYHTPPNRFQSSHNRGFGSGKVQTT